MNVRYVPRQRGHLEYQQHFIGRVCVRVRLRVRRGMSSRRGEPCRPCYVARDPVGCGHRQDETNGQAAGQPRLGKGLDTQAPGCMSSWADCQGTTCHHPNNECGHKAAPQPRQCNISITLHGHNGDRRHQQPHPQLETVPHPQSALHQPTQPHTHPSTHQQTTNNKQRTTNNEQQNDNDAKRKIKANERTNERTNELR